MGRKTRTYTTKTVLSKKFKPFKSATERLKQMLGEHIEPCATIYVYGNSGHGKSTFVNEIYQELSKCVKKIYHNNVESGFSRVLQLSIEKLDLQCLVVWADRHSFEEMKTQVSANRCNVFGLDSVDKSKITHAQYLELEKICKKQNKIGIFIGRANGKQHASSTGHDICFDADVKVFVDEGIAYVDGRYGSVPPYVMEGVAAHHAKKKAILKKVKKGELFSEAAAAREEKLSK